jgi:hypothetical protein
MRVGHPLQLGVPRQFVGASVPKQSQGAEPLHFQFRPRELLMLLKLLKVAALWSAPLKADR